MKLFENQYVKVVRSKDYNYNFDKNTGYFERWGKTIEEDPVFSIYGPEICDMEVTTICNGIGDKGPCKFCYKSNTKNGKNMSFEKFKELFDVLPNVLNQIALGCDSKCESNPDIFKMMKYCRDKGVVPNITVADITKETAKKLAVFCGAVSVSYYGDKDICFNSVKHLTDVGLKQVNIHAMIAEETFKQTLDLFDEYLYDKRLKDLNAIVMLSLKQKGRGESYSTLNQEKFNILCDYAKRLDIPIGFDSCSSHKFMSFINNDLDKDDIIKYIEPCESSLFSIYCDVNGIFYPCSFCENIIQGVGDKDDFLKNVWNQKIIKDFRNNLINNNRKCPIYNI